MATNDYVFVTLWRVRGNDWRLRAEKPLLRNRSFIFKPLFRWNHRWAMARGQEGLHREMMSAR